MDKKNILMVSIIVVCVVILVALGINAFASSGGNLTNYVSGGSCSGIEGGCSPAEQASCSSATVSGGCGSTAGGCGSASSCGSSATSNVDFERLEAEAISYYTSQTGETGIDAKAYTTAEGIEVAIIKDKKIIDVISFGASK